jgi:hypothetical protein
MNCARIEQDDIIERYLAGKLPATLGEEFEDHYFGCDNCLHNLQVMCAAQTSLRDRQTSIRTEHRWRRGPVWAAAALLAAGLAVAFVLSRRPPTPPSLAEHPPPPREQPAAPPKADPFLALARFDPPPYREVAMRDAGSPGKVLFTAAMREYSAAHYTEAIPGLRRALEKEPDNPAYAFFLGVTCLLADQTEAGINALQKVADAGDSPFQEEAWFYLAKAHLRRHSVGATRAAVQRVIDMQGEHAAEARIILIELGPWK